MTHDEMIKRMLAAPEIKAEYDNLEAEFSLLDELLQARKNAGLTQAQVAKRKGTKATAITRLESGLASATNVHATRP
ncbi:MULTISPECIES: helix-turn-helix domain-containing protein [unclassified Brenneria]|uniref:helix-turn-helix domain-containing protein n=1 Tax=unclassified Brenneria TaxID=2634434 RepID=UPI001F45104D|nr:MULTISPECIES: helix-turn-helix transcriptional regulator [unclassified Brenneria]MEE3643810.1 helix-turn-helix transcriptional regulator [Brenneria sp. L3_3C_1]MEE3651237.1 helix-turn-helix transcriptional regulator [Brenneria sp. HEZEL_4_2_4]